MAQQHTEGVTENPPGDVLQPSRWRRGDEPELTRLAAFTDGVYAIAPTPLVLNIRVGDLRDEDSTAARWRAPVGAGRAGAGVGVPDHDAVRLPSTTGVLISWAVLMPLLGRRIGRIAPEEARRADHTVVTARGGRLRSSDGDPSPTKRGRRRTAPANRPGEPRRPPRGRMGHGPRSPPTPPPLPGRPGDGGRCAPRRGGPGAVGCDRLMVPA